MHFIFLSFLSIAQAFFRSEPKLCKISNREVHTVIPHNSPLISKISGFYGLIGPDINKTNINSLYGLFTGDGVIQGAFFDKETITFVRHFVRTEKLVFESIHGKFSDHMMMTPLYMAMHKLGILPNIMGLANTALLKIDNQIFALFERDSPYQISIDFEKNHVSTVTKKHIPGVRHFSGHSKYDAAAKMVHTIDYDVLRNNVAYVRIHNNSFQKSIIPTKYIPIVHDFALLNATHMFFVDSPFVWNFRKKIPVAMDASKPTYIELYDTTKNVCTRIICPESFYVFHYGSIEEGSIYAPLYDTLDFGSLELAGKYREIRLLTSSQVVIKKNPALEQLNLDFPMKWQQYVVLREVENRTITGFVVCKQLNIVRKLRLPENRLFCGEPAIIEVEGSPFLIGFAYDKEDNGYMVLLGIFTDEYVEIPLGQSVSIGFHSIFTTV
jgi:carotenoid cleavage dioxygenase-like enzyme